MRGESHLGNDEEIHIGEPFQETLYLMFFYILSDKQGLQGNYHTAFGTRPNARACGRLTLVFMVLCISSCRYVEPHNFPNVQNILFT